MSNKQDNELNYDKDVPESIELFDTTRRPATLEVKRNQLRSFKDFKSNSRTMIFGLSGSGKSVFFDKLIHNLAKRTLVILIDTKREYTHVKALNPKTDFNKRVGLRRVYELVYEGFVVDNLYDVCDFLSENMFERGNCMLAIEELGEVLKKKGGRLYDTNRNFAKLLQQGRKKNVGFIGVSQRPTEIPTTVLSQCNNVITFYFHQPHDKEYFRYYFPLHLLDTMKRFEFVRYHQGDDYIYYHYKLYLSDAEIRYYTNLFGES